MIDMANLTLTQPNVSTSHLKKMAEGSPATVTVALTLASTPDMFMCLCDSRCADVTSVKCERVTPGDYIRVSMSAVSPATCAD